MKCLSMSLQLCERTKEANSSKSSFNQMGMQFLVAEILAITGAPFQDGDLYLGLSQPRKKFGNIEINQVFQKIS